MTQGCAFGDYIIRDTRANQPAFNAVAPGTMYYVTDEGVLERSNYVSAWESMSLTSALTTELAQDAVGAMIDTTLVYVDGSPLLTRAALTGDVTAAQGSNALALATVNAGVGTFGSATQTVTTTVNGKGLVTAMAHQAIAIPSTQVTDFTEAAQDAIGAMVDSSLTYTDGTPLLKIATSGISAGAFVNPSSITFDAMGRATAATSGPRTVTEASNATPTPNADTTDVHTVTAQAAAAAWGAPTGTPVNGQVLVLRMKDNGTARAVSWNAIYRATTEAALPTTTVLGKELYSYFIYDSTATKWDHMGSRNVA